MITVSNIHANVSKIPLKYKEDLPIILEAINVKLHEKDSEVNFVVDQILKQINAELETPKQTKKEYVKTPKAKTEPKEKVKSENAKKSTEIFDLPTSKINVDISRFQNRNKLNETVLNQIVNNYSSTKLDPVIVWKDSNGKTYLLAGHHRLEATKRVGKKTIPAKYFTGNEAEAIKYAKFESNANRSLELPQERAKIYREMIQSGMTKAAVSVEAKKLEGKNANYILNLSYLNPKGIILQAVDSLSETSDKQNATLIEKIADWIGEVRRNNERLTDAHEKEMFDFLQDKELSKRIKTKSEFMQKIHSISGAFDFDSEQPLNLKRLKYQTQGEQVYDAEYKDLQQKIDELLSKKENLKDRIKNPNNANYINPNSKDFNSIMIAYDNSVSKINSEIAILQQKIIKLQQSKGKYTNSSVNQAALFRPKTKKEKPLNGLVDNVVGNMIANSVLGEPEAPKVQNKLMQMEFDTLQINDEWKELMQEPAANMKIAIWGAPKNGKTAGSLQMANYLTNFGNVLYNFADQGFNKSTQDLWISSGLANNSKAEPSDISNSKELEKEIATGKYKFVFIDMISDYIRTEKLRPEEFKERFIKQFPNVSFILIFEVTKGGNFKGDQGWTHLVDAIMTVEDFLIENRGRYGMGQRIIWEDGFKKFNPKKYQEYIEQKNETQPEKAPEEIAPVENMNFNFVVQ